MDQITIVKRQLRQFEKRLGKRHLPCRRFVNYLIRGGAIEIDPLPDDLQDTKELLGLLSKDQLQRIQDEEESLRILKDIKLLEKYKKIDADLFKLQTQIFCKKYSGKVGKKHKRMINEFCGVEYFDLDEEKRKLSEFEDLLKRLQ